MKKHSKKRDPLAYLTTNTFLKIYGSRFSAHWFVCVNNHEYRTNYFYNKLFKREDILTNYEAVLYIDG